MQHFRQICLCHCPLGCCSVQCTPDQTCTEKHSRPTGKLTDSRQLSWKRTAPPRQGLRLSFAGGKYSKKRLSTVSVHLLQAVLQATEQATQGSGKKASQNGLLHPQYCESVYKSIRRPTRTIEVTRASLSLGSALSSSCCASAETHEPTEPT